MNIKSIEDLRESIQDDLSCLLDGDEHKINLACQIVCDRFEIYQTLNTNRD